jgi:hypothetical protein
MEGGETSTLLMLHGGDLAYLLSYSQQRTEKARGREVQQTRR